MTTTAPRSLAFTAALAAMAGLCSAQDTPSPVSDQAVTPQQPPARAAHARIELRGLYAPSSDFKDAPGGVSVGRAAADFRATFPVLDRSQLSILGSSELSWYGFDSDTVIGGMAGKPWDDITTLDLRARFATQIDQHWSAYGTIGLESSGEEGADFSDTLTYGGAAGFEYAFSENLKAGLGLLARTRLEDNAIVLPIITLDWTFAPRWNLSTTYGPTGAGLALAWTPRDDLTFTLAGAWEAREFRLDDRTLSPTPGFIGRDERIPVWLGARWQATEQFSLSARLGAYMWQQISLDDAGGDELGSEETDATAFAELGVRWEF